MPDTKVRTVQPSWIRPEDRPRVLSILALMVAAISTATLAARAAGGPVPLKIVFLFAASLPLWLAFPLMPSRWSRSDALSWLFNGGLVLLLASISFFAGGVNSVVLIGMPLIPIVVTAMLGIRAGWIFAAVIGLYFFIFALLHWHGFDFPDDPRPPREEALQLAVMYGLILVLVVVAASTLDTQLNLMRAQLVRQANLDPLTTLHNRRAFDFDLQRWAALPRRRQSHRLLMLIDIDRFKELNDRYGHVQGDECLIRVAAQLSKAAQRVDGRCYRIAGDEFALLFDCRDGQRGMTTAKALCRSIAQEHWDNSQGESLGASVSIGVAEQPEDTPARPAAWLEQADLALYEAKAQGRNTAVQFQAEMLPTQREEAGLSSN